MTRQTEHVTPMSSLSDRIYGLIREDIISCVLLPGQSVTEGQLAELHGVGKAPVRLALASLSREGLVTAVPRQGHVVSEITIESVNDVFGVRLIIEPATARLAAGRVDAERLKALHANLTKENLALNASQSKRIRRINRNPASERRWLEANNDFHLEIARATGNERLVKITANILEESRRAVHLLFSVYDQTEELRDDHPNLISTLAAGKADEAAAVAREHIERTRRIVIDALLNNSTVRRVSTERGSSRP